MGIKVKATCSECLTMHSAMLEFGQENIQCPACGHSMKNLPEGELNEIDLQLKKQKTRSIIALTALGVGVLCFFLWAFNLHPGLYHFPQDEVPQEARESMMVTIMPWLSVLGLLVGLVFSVLGSLKRYLIEF